MRRADGIVSKMLHGRKQSIGRPPWFFDCWVSAKILDEGIVIGTMSSYSRATGRRR
jgi:hypothetical protein